jgi:ABC-2 type transport system permease protein
MSALTAALPVRAHVLIGELAKLPAFFRRDFLVAWSYRFAFVSDWGSLALQVLMFSFVGRLVDPSKLPMFGGRPTSYIEFVTIGVAMGSFIQLALHRVASGLRSEQMLGTLETLLMTPTAPSTIQIGTVFYDLLYIPVRSALFLGVVAIAFGLHLHASGLLPALLLLLAFIPFVWGLGMASAGLILTLRRGTAVSSFGAAILLMFSGAYFPLDVLPHWVRGAASVNPVAIAVGGIRRALLGGADWHAAAIGIAELLPFAAVAIGIGITVFRASLRRERRRGSLGLY